MPSVNEAYLNFYYEKTSVFNGAYDNALKITSRYNNNVININQYSGEYPFNEYVPGIVNIQYSLDNGMSWNDINDDGTLCTLSAGQSVLLKGTNTNTYYERGEPDPLAFNWCIGSTYEYDVSGNPLSLIVEDNFDKIDDLTDIGDEYGHATEHLLEGLFYHSQVVDASGLQLKAKTLTKYCYANMFKDCMLLEKAPKLPATTLADYCYSGMFNNCSMALTTAPDLPATTLAPHCYQNMFIHCESLIAPPNILPATTLAEDCYNAMFLYCEDLTFAPALPATTLAPRCYMSMFAGCESLVTAPALPATTLAVGCYYNMFNGCSLITAAPLLPATSLPQLCYAQMFADCTSLNYIKILATSREVSSLTQWVYNVAPTGTFVKDSNATYPIDSDSGVPVGWTVYDIGDNIPNQYNVTLSVYPTGTGAVNGGGTYIEDTSITVNAVPAAGYVFIGWYDRDDFMEYGPSIDPVSTNASYTFSLHDNTDLIAMFDTTPPCVIILSQSPNVGATMTGAGSYINVVAVIVTTTNVEGYNFVGWQLNGTIVSTSLSYRIACTPGTIALTAVYEAIPVYTDCNVTIQINKKYLGTISYVAVQPDGTTLTNSTDRWYNRISYLTCPEGTVLTLTATPDDNVNFIDWKKDNVVISTSNQTQVTITGNTAILGEFEVDDYEQCYLTIENVGDNGLNSICIFYGDNPYRQAPTETMTLQYRINNDGEWRNLDNLVIRKNDQPISIASLGPYDAVSFRNFSVCGHVVRIVAPYSFRAYGNIMSLLPAHFDSVNSTNDVYHGINTTVLGNDEGFAYLFSVWSSANIHTYHGHIVDASNLILPATTLSYRCYMYMFSSFANSEALGMTTLIYPPELPATTLAEECYLGMFANNNSLTTVPSNMLPATTLATYCYNYMFLYCKRLTNVPMLPATTLAEFCYAGMFNSCISLTTVPSNMLPATTLSRFCYSVMFAGCTALTTAPELPATTLTEGCYLQMFENCLSLTTAPTLSATTLTPSCYGNMFQGCTALTTAPTISATTLALQCCFCMFMNCTSLTTAPTLSATTLADLCYNSMFYGCTSLTTAPVLPATTLVSNCYNSMFEGCSNLNNVTCFATDISADNCTMRWLADVKNIGTFTKATSMTDWTTGISGIPANWTVQNAT